jgi:hypothetical protein
LFENHEKPLKCVSSQWLPDFYEIGRCFIDRKPSIGLFRTTLHIKYFIFIPTHQEYTLTKVSKTEILGHELCGTNIGQIKG